MVVVNSRVDDGRRRRFVVKYDVVFVLRFSSGVELGFE